jgi:hypothetical protein
MPERRPQWLPSPRQELLLVAALGSPDRASAAWDELGPQLDLNSIPHHEFRMLPLLYRNLTLIGASDPVMARLKGIYKRTWYHNQLRLRKAERVIATLQHHDFDVILLKGGALVDKYYADRGARPMQDLDIAVTKDATRAAAVLAESGWRIEKPIPSSQPRFMHAIPLFDTDGDSCDLHWYVMEQLTSAPEEENVASLFESGTTTRIGETDVRTLSTVDQLIHICVHAAQWVPTPNLYWIGDVHTIVLSEPDDLNWEALGARVKDLRCTRQVAVTLGYVAQLLHTPIPKELIDALGRASERVRDKLAFRLNCDLVQEPAWWSPRLTVGYWMRATAGWPWGKAIRAAPRCLQDLWWLESRSDLPIVARRKFRARIHARVR